MRQCLLASLLACSILLLAACGPSAPIKPEEPVYIRPVVVPEKGEVELVAAVALLKDKNYRQAEVNLEEIVKVREDLPEAHFNLGWVRMQLGKYVEAIDALQVGLKLRPQETSAYRLIGICQRELGRFTDAEQTYATALTQAPDDPGVHLNLGILYELYLQNPRMALEHYRRYQLLRGAPDNKVAGWIAVLERAGNAANGGSQ